jgi:hypothetical protein
VDEAQTGLKTLQPTFQGFWHAFRADECSNQQQPLHNFYIWVWAQIFGVSEIKLRAANLPWFFLGFFAIARALRRHVSLRNATLLVYCVHPFVWYYVNEARPYLMQISGAILVSAALFDALDDEDALLPAAWWWQYGLGLFVLCGSAMLGTAWGVGLTLFLCCRRNFRRSIFQGGRYAVLVFVPLMISLAGYYVWTISQHLRAAYQSMTLLGLGFDIYELLGFAGLGPGRMEVRPGNGASSGVESLAVFAPYFLPLLLLLLPLAWGFFLAARERFGLTRARLVAVALAYVLPLLAVIAMGRINHVRVLGRHLGPFLPFLLIGEAYIVCSLWQSGRPIRRAVAALLLAALCLSSLELRFESRHLRDDFRDAVADAKDALQNGKRVWWVADLSGAQYYRLPYSFQQEPGIAYRVHVVTPADAAPDLIFVSRPDICDIQGSVGQYIATHHYRLSYTLPAFTIWQPPAQ